MISPFGRGADCREAEIAFLQVAIVFCLLQCIRHDAPPKKRRLPMGEEAIGVIATKTRQSDAGSQGADYDRAQCSRYRGLIDSLLKHSFARSGYSREIRNS